MTVRIINADVMDGLAQLDDESVHCCVTSPPYWGLRDYGTGKWTGGDDDCDHVSHEIRTGLGMAALGEKYAGGGKKAAEPKPVQFRDVCGKCGAQKVDNQIGLEPTLQEHIAKLVLVFREVRRVLRKDGTLWLNYGDAYSSGAGGDTAKFCPGVGRADGIIDERGQRNRNGVTGSGIKSKNLMLMPERLAIALCDDGWYIRSRIIWHKPNPMPESVTDRPTKSHEHIWLMSRSPRYFYDAEAISEEADVANFRDCPTARRDTKPGSKPDSGFLNGRYYTTRNARDVWTIATSPFAEAHFATFPPELAERCIKAGCPENGTVLDPFAGSGTTGLVADRLQRNAVMIELNPTYAAMARKRVTNDCPLFMEVPA